MSNLVIAALGLATGSLAARLLGPHGRGELAAIQLVAATLSVAALFGIPGAIVYHTARAPDRARTIYMNGIAASLGAALISVLVGYVLVPAMLAGQPAATRHAALWYLLFLPLLAFHTLPYSVLLGLKHFGWWNVLRCMPGIWWLAVLAWGWSAGWRRPEFYAAAYLAAFALSAAVATAVMTRFSKPAPLELDAGTARALLGYSTPGVLSTVPSALTARLDQVLIATVLPPAMLGLYAVAVSWGSALTLLLGSAGPIVVPYLAGRTEQDGPSELVRRGGRAAILLAGAGTACLLALTPWVVPLLFGPAFAPAIRATMLLVCAGGFAGLNGILEEVLRGLGAPRWPLYAQLIGLPTAVTLLILFLPRWGIVGAATAAAMSQLTIALALVMGVCRVTGSSFSQIAIPGRPDLARIVRLARRAGQATSLSVRGTDIGN